MCVGCDPESYTWPDISSNGAATEPRPPLTAGWEYDGCQFEGEPIIRWTGDLPYWLALPPWNPTP